MVLVDSCVWIEAARSKGLLEAKLALRTLLEEDEACFCGPIRLEVVGAVRSEQRERFSRQMEVVPYLAMKESQWQEAVKLSWKMRDSGVIIPWNDLLIASIAILHQVRLYTLDHHFEPMTQIAGLSLYTPGYGGTYQPG